MIGGIVTHICDLPNENKIYIGVQNGGQQDGIYVERNYTSLGISKDDDVWWHGDYAYWTPSSNSEEQIGIKDVKIKRIGYSGNPSPCRPVIELTKEHFWPLQLKEALDKLKK